MVTFGLPELIIIAAQHLFSQPNKSLNENLFEFSIVVLKSFESYLSYSSTLEHRTTNEANSEFIVYHLLIRPISARYWSL